MPQARSPHDPDVSASQLGKVRALQGAIALSLLALGVQVVGAFYTGSLALLGDTAHLFTDLLSLIMSLAAILLAARPATVVRSFGLFRLEVLAAFCNGLLLLVAGVWLFVEAVERLQNPEPVLAIPLLAVAAAGLVLNLLSALLLSRAIKGGGHHHHHGHGHGHGHEEEAAHEHGHGDSHGHGHHHDDRNLRGAMLHVLSDALGSVAVVIGAAVAYYTGWLWVDPLLAVLLAGVNVRWAWRLLYDSGHVLLEGTPRHLAPEEIVRSLRALDARVGEIEDLHVWEITSRMYAATAEVRVGGTLSLQEVEGLRRDMRVHLKEKYGIAHVVLEFIPSRS